MRMASGRIATAALKKTIGAAVPIASSTAETGMAISSQ